MKFTVSYARKVKAGLAYEMMEIFASVESDSSIETMEKAYARIRRFVDNHIDFERDRLLKTCVK